MPSQNDGVAMPPMASVRTTTSIQVFCFSAEMVPSGIAIRMAMTVASSAISSEIGSRVRISGETGLPDHIEVPKSKWKKPQTKSRNWMISGRSSPSSAWQASTARGSKLPPPEPRRTTQMSPGIRRISRNTSAAAPSSVGITSSTRFDDVLVHRCGSLSQDDVPGQNRRRLLHGPVSPVVASSIGPLVQPDIRQILVDDSGWGRSSSLSHRTARGSCDSTTASETHAPRYRRCASRTAASAPAAWSKSVSRSILS